MTDQNALFEAALDAARIEGARRALLISAEAFSLICKSKIMKTAAERALLRSIVKTMRETASNPAELADLISSEPKIQ